MSQTGDHMSYQSGMEILESNIMTRVLAARENYQPERFSPADVQQALRRDSLTIPDYAALLSPAATVQLEAMAAKAATATRRHFGSSVQLFTPLYIANYCENHCVYCGFNCRNRINRGRLTLTEIEAELQSIAATGLKEILLLSGESRHHSGPEYLGEAVRLAARYFPSIGIEVYPLNRDEYAYLHDCGADFVSVYQETYNPAKYAEVHRQGPKRSYPYRFHAQERALQGGMRGVAFGALLGLDDFRRDAFAAGLHARFIQQKYPGAEISFSVPRLRPYINNTQNLAADVHERQLLQVMLAYRLFLPFAGITISTRERAGFRNQVIGLAANKMSAGVCVGVGGHQVPEKGDEQFAISDSRSVPEVHRMILARGLQPVYSDYVRM